MKLLTFFLLIFTTLTSCGHKVRETFLIPEGFEGRINVIFNQLEGDAVKIVNERRIYNIPNDGILVTSSKIETGWLDQEYFYVDRLGNKTRIDIRDFDSKEVPKHPKVIYSGVVGVYGNSTDKNPLEFIENVIGSKKTIDSIYNQKNQQKFEDLIMEKVGRKF